MPVAYPHRGKTSRRRRAGARLREAGAIIGIAASPVQVRNPGGQGVETTAGAFMRSDLPITGFALIDAENVEDAIDQGSFIEFRVILMYDQTFHHFASFHQNG